MESERLDKSPTNRMLPMPYWSIKPFIPRPVKGYTYNGPSIEWLLQLFEFTELTGTGHLFLLSLLTPRAYV
jgi:hypothetical protein